MSKLVVPIVAAFLGFACMSFAPKAQSMTPVSSPFNGEFVAQRPTAPSGLWRVWAVNGQGRTVRSMTTSIYTTALNTQRAWSVEVNPQGGRAYMKKIR